jgi:hypothetical protein
MSTGPRFAAAKQRPDRFESFVFCSIRHGFEFCVPSLPFPPLSSARGPLWAWLASDRMVGHVHGNATKRRAPRREQEQGSRLFGPPLFPPLSSRPWWTLPTALATSWGHRTGQAAGQDRTADRRMEGTKGEAERTEGQQRGEGATDWAAGPDCSRTHANQPACVRHANKDAPHQDPEAQWHAMA